VNALDAFSDMQFVEEALRMYLMRVYALIRKRLKNEVGFSYKYNDVEKDSLGRLVGKFQRHCDNADLVGKLKALPNERNFLAHQSFLLRAEEWNDEAHMDSLNERATKAKASARGCFFEVLGEMTKLDKLLEEEVPEPGPAAKADQEEASKHC